MPASGAAARQDRARGDAAAGGARPAGAVGDEERALIAAQYTLYNEVLPALKGRRAPVHHAECKPEQRAWVREYFMREVRPLLTPIGLDPSHPFPQVLNKS